MGLIYLLFRDPLAFILLAVPLLYSIIFHELAHGWAADKFGDHTARMLGRLSLNPMKHLDPMGTLMLFLFGFGWAKPVPVNFNNLRNTGKAVMWVSSAGIIANIAIAFLCIFLIQTLPSADHGINGIVLSTMARINIMLASFNLIPIPPLDGSKIFMGFLPPKYQYLLSRLEPYGLFIIIGLLYLNILDPLIHFFSWLILSIINLLLFR
jgi:Zn-dependent protease